MDTIVETLHDFKCFTGAREIPHLFVAKRSVRMIFRSRNPAEGTISRLGNYRSEPAAIPLPPRVAGQ
jgi:hypothetical protein